MFLGTFYSIEWNEVKPINKEAKKAYLMVNFLLDYFWNIIIIVPFLGCVSLLVKLDSLFNKNYTKRILISLFHFPPEFHSQFQWKNDLIFRGFYTLVKITRISLKIPLPQWFFKTRTFLTHFLVFRKILRTYLNTRWSLTTKSNQFTYLHL